MAITSITIQEDNIVNGSNLLAVHSPVSFICNANYTGSPPDEVIVEIRETDDTVLETYRAIPYRDTILGQRQFIFLASEAIRALLDSFEEFVQLEDTLEYVEGLTRNLKVRFIDPEDSDNYAESTLDFCHAAKQFGQRPNMQDQFDNDPDTYYAPKNKPCYVYFYNDDATNSIDTIPSTADPLVLFSESPVYFGYVAAGLESAEISVDITGTNIDGDIVLNAGSGFELSLTSGSGFTNILTIPYSGASMSDTIYIKFTPQATLYYNTLITPLVNGVSRNNTLRLIGTAKQTIEVLATPGLVPWVCPTGIEEVKVECYGGGGAGAAASNGGEAGGAGGQYAMADLTLVPGRTYNIQIADTVFGTNGEDSYFYDTVATSYLVTAKGGARATPNGSGTNPGLGSLTGGIGDTVYSGGDGANGGGPTYDYGGGGGGGAGSSGNGGDATDEIGGSSGGGYASNGGGGGTAYNLPGNGYPAGGGGGGAYNDDLISPGTNGGQGARGVVVLTYPDYS